MIGVYQYGNPESTYVFLRRTVIKLVGRNAWLVVVPLLLIENLRCGRGVKVHQLLLDAFAEGQCAVGLLTVLAGQNLVLIADTRVDVGVVQSLVR